MSGTLFGPIQACASSPMQQHCANASALVPPGGEFMRVVQLEPNSGVVLALS